MADPTTRQGKRTPVTLKIKFKSETLEQFIERYAVDVSPGGIFIRTKDPLAVGTQMKFEFQLRDASPLIAGEGTVVWTRENDPSRPAIHPGMGVRFDRLADGSQTVLEKILSEKSKQAPGRSHSDSAQNRAAVFMDTPTRVAPAPVQEELGLRSRSDSEQTPLPKPMPFHSDADDFDEKAFEEATKVRSLDDLVAQTAGQDGFEHDLLDGPGNATKVMPADELAVRRQAGRADSTIADPPLLEPPEENNPRLATKSHPDRDSAPGLPSPPAVEGVRPPRMLDDGPQDAASRPSRESQPDLDDAGGSPGRTKLGLEPAKAATGAATASAADAPTSAKSSAKDAARAVPAEPARPLAPSRPSSAAPLVIGLLVVAAAGLAAVWWFVLREQVAQETVDTTTRRRADPPPDPGRAVAAGSADVGPADVPPDLGSTGEPAAGSEVAAVPAGPTVATIITSPVKGTTIEVIGTDQKGAAPFTARLEKDQPYKARVSAPGYETTEIDVKPGEKATAKLVLKPRVITVSSEPAGAEIYIDYVNTKQVTPADVQLTAAQAAKPRVRVTLRRPGYKAVDRVVDASAFKDEASRMTHSVEATMQVAPRPTSNVGNGGTGGEGQEPGTGTKTGTGTATPPAGPGSAPPASTPSSGTSPSPPPPREPEPDWTK